MDLYLNPEFIEVKRKHDAKLVHALQDVQSARILLSALKRKEKELKVSKQNFELINREYKDAKLGLDISNGHLTEQGKTISRLYANEKANQERISKVMKENSRLGILAITSWLVAVLILFFG